MQLSIKKFILLTCTSISIGLYAASSASSAALPAGGAASGQQIPSVADVFGGLSEEEIAKQVQMGQNFLTELQQHGSPEEIAEFYKMLEDTINNMTDQDFKDIQAISEMVQPYMPTPEPTPTPAVSTVSSAVSSSSIDDSTSNKDALDEFKNLINTIIQRIDDIFQKINSSKECQELADVEWKNKSTFGNMKRLILQLKNDRLAKKLAKDDLSGDDKNLVDQLKEFLKILTKYNNALVIEDDFGLPATMATDKKYVKETKSFLNSCDDTIDTIMPLLEKFIQKHDPEALQMAKEAEEKIKKAQKDATDAAKRSPSAPTTAKSRSGSTAGYPSSGYGYDNYGGHPDYYGDSDYGRSGSSGSDDATPGAKSGGASGDAKTTSTPKTETKAKEEAKDAKKSDSFNATISDLDDYLTDEFPKAHETDFIQFLKGIGTSYPPYYEFIDHGDENSRGVTGSSGQTSPGQEEAWINSTSPFTSGATSIGFKKYTTDVLNTFKSNFAKEFKSAGSILSDLKDNMHKYTAQDLKDLQNHPKLTQLENRLKTYQKAYESSLPLMEKTFAANIQDGGAPVTTIAPPPQYLHDTNMRNMYRQRHEDFTNQLNSEISDEIDSLLNKINSIKRKAKRDKARK